MKHNKEKHTTVSVDIGLFLYLQEKVCERKTKTEAYCNLLKKASENFVSPILKNRNQELNINQCHVTITDLSVEWHWHRSTVRSFLETLEEYGQIEIIRLPKSFLLTMPVGINGTEDFGLTNKLQTVLSNWESDNMSTLEAGEKCMNLLKEDIKHFTEVYQTQQTDAIGNLQQAKEAHFKIAKQQYLESMAMAAYRKVISRSANSSTDAMVQFYDNDLDGDSSALLEASQVLAELLIYGMSSSLTNETPQTKAQFHNLLDAYRSLLAQSIGHTEHL